MSIKRTMISVVFCIVILLQLVAVAGCKRGGDTSSLSESSQLTSSSGSEEDIIVPLTYPSDSVCTIEQLGMKEGDYIRKNRGPYSYQGNSGHEEPTVIVSPYYTLKINDKAIPVYSTVVYVGLDGECALHSYAMIELRPEQAGSIDIVLNAVKYDLEEAIVLPESLGIVPEIFGSEIRASVSDTGDYTFLMNDEDSDVSQYNAFTLFVRDYNDEEEEIAKYIDQYGADNVKIYEAGTHLIDNIHITEDDSVVYLKRGALLIPKGNPDYSEENQYTELGARESNGWGLTRYPIITANGRKNITITGRGTIDAGQLGWHERRGIMVTNSENVEISGLTLVNFPEWTITTYVCTNIDISDIRVFGYKTNSDGIAICNSKNAVVKDSFARSGDDLFEVKTMGGPLDSSSEDILFENCIAWAGKARCFGVIAELSRDVSDITFMNCAVLIRDAVWDNSILGSLVVIGSDGTGNVSNVTFENIEIYKDYGRAINIAVTNKELKTKKIENIVFRNIKYNSDKPNNLNSLLVGSNKIEAIFENVTGNDELLTESNIDKHFEYDAQTKITFRTSESGSEYSSSISSSSSSSMFPPSSSSLSSTSSLSVSSPSLSDDPDVKIPGSVTPVTLPTDRVRKISDLGSTESSYKAKAAQSASYTGNEGWDVSSIVVSPYYTLKVNGISVPVYASPVYVAESNSGALQSFAMIDVPKGDYYYDISLSAQGVSFNNSIVLPESLGIVTDVQANKSISARITDFGFYNFLVLQGGARASQQYAFVLIVRESVDEAAEIASYKSQYGENNVVVYEPGTHYIDYINVDRNNMIYYLKRGSLIVLNHTLDIDSEDDNQNKSEPGAVNSTGWGLNRYPVLAAKNKSNIRIVGRGTFDGGQLDWHERRGLHFSSCSGVVIDGINIINFPEWGVISYICNDVTIRNVMLLGWKTNSDAFALCNTKNSVVDMCFARTGDDMFEVKTLGGPADAITDNVLFTNCYSWGSKARSFGITGEVEKDITNVTFRDCAVIYRDAIWDNDRLGSLAIIPEVGNGNITNILFKNIEIYFDFGRAINATIKNTNSPTNIVSGLVFENVSYSADMKSQIKTRVPGTNSISAEFRNVRSEGYLITQSNYAADVVLSGANSQLSVIN